MSKNAKLMIGALVVLVVALLGMVIFGSALLALGLLVLGGLGVVALIQRLPEDGDDQGTPKAKKGGGRSKLDDAIENTRPLERRPSAPSSGGLPTWSPGGLDTWSPSNTAEEPAVEEAPAGRWDSWDNDWASDSASDSATAVDAEPNPLDALDRLDDIDPIAEVERLDALDQEAYDPLASLDTVEELDEIEVEYEEPTVDLDEAPAAPAASGGFSFSSAPPVVNEEVASADDIMAASQATELELPAADGGDSELARLLAKVQARLAAYE